MARNTIRVDVPPEAVFEVLADPRLLGNWVVGASRTRRVEGQWPEPGSLVHHSQMMLVNDTTVVIECEPPLRLRLKAHARPLAIVEVDVKLEADGDGTRIILDERAIGGLAVALPDRLIDGLIHLRNSEGIRRLKWLAEIGRHLRSQDPVASGGA